MNNFVILVPAYNCANKIYLTIRSVAMQTYPNWRMIIVDDMSTDNTRSVIDDCILEYRIPNNKVSVIRRTEKYGEVRNTVDVCQNLNENDIVVRLDAGDWLTDMGCLQILEMVYHAHSPAVMWTSQRWSWTNQSICGAIDPNVSVYHQPWKSSHLKTFRVADFLKVDSKNFKDEDGQWIMIACDQAIFLPMMEIARLTQRPLIYLPMIMYHYDIDLDDPNLFKHDRSINQKMSAEKIRRRGLLT